MIRKLFLFLVLGAVVLAACGKSEDSVSSTGEPPPAETPAAAEDKAAFPVTIDNDGRGVTIDEEPASIVSLSPTATEMLFAIGAGEQVVAADEFSNFPEGAPTTDLSGFTPNIEAILEFEPDFVVAQDDPGELVSGLEGADVPILLQPPAVTIDDTYAQMNELGEATGHVEEAATAVEEIETEIAGLLAGVPEGDDGPTYYYELDPTFFTATSSTFIGELFASAGLQNIADPADDGSGFPQLNAEFIIEADPAFVFLADTVCCDQNAESVAARPGFDGLTAVQEEGHVVELNDDIASRWGPRVVDLLEIIVEATAPVPAG